MKFRKEFDSIGTINVPNDKYWGASTQRSKKYFDIGEFLVRPRLIKSIAIIKKAAAKVHMKEKQILPKICRAIISASNEVISGKLNDKEKVSTEIIKYVNRLSDFLFVAARFENKKEGDILWIPNKN